MLHALTLSAMPLGYIGRAAITNPVIARIYNVAGNLDRQSVGKCNVRNGSGGFRTDSKPKRH